MADYYDNYSVPLPYKTGEERKWLLERLEAELCEPENEKLIPQLFPDYKDFDASFWPGLEVRAQIDSERRHRAREGAGSAAPRAEHDDRLLCRGH